MIRGSKRVIVNQPPTTSLEIHNRFDIEVVDAETGAIKREAKAYNVVCNQLWTRLFSKNAYFAYIHYGSGTGTPSVTDTALFKYAGGQQATGGDTAIDYKNGVFSLRRQIQLLASTAVGVTITEVGIAYGSNSSYLCTHAMLQDMNGNPISIEKTDTDVINIYATVYVHFDPSGYDGGCIRPSSYTRTQSLFAFLCGYHNVLANRMYVTAFDTADLYTSMGGAYPNDGYNHYVDVSTVFNAENKTITFTPKRVESDKYNVGGFRYLYLAKYVHGSSYDTYEPYFFVRPGGSWFPYSQVTAEAIGTGDGSTSEYSLAFPFVYDLKVYVDGVETSDFTYDCAPNNASNFMKYMRTIHSASTADNLIDEAAGEANRILYNPSYEIGIDSISTYLSTEICTSDDLVTWVTLQSVAGGDESSSTRTKISVPPEYVHYKYWRQKEVYKGTTYSPPTTFTGKNLHFNTPPAAGSVITVDYKTDTIAKDANHVFDFSLVIQLGEYTEAQ